MYLQATQLDLVAASLLFPVWLIAAILVGRPAARRTRRGMRVFARLALGFVLAGMVFGMARLVTFGMVASHGWVFAGDRRLATTLLVMIPALTTPVAVIRLWRLIREAGADRDAPVTADLRAAAAAPWLVLPVQATAAAALVCMLEPYLKPTFLLMNLLLFGTLLVVAVGLLYVRARHRVRRLGQPDVRLRATGRGWLVRLGTVAVAVGVIAGLFSFGMSASALPETFDMMTGKADYGGGPVVNHDHGAGGPGTVSVNDLTGPRDGVPDRKFTLTAQEAQIRLSSGVTVPAWTFNGQVPGPELRVREGELVEITLVNKLPEAPVTIHWHGVDVPNREDGVAGVTQDAVQPGDSYTYRFRVEESGTRWYHSHQAGSEQVLRGLFGPLIIEPAQPTRQVDEDVPVVLHGWEPDLKEEEESNNSLLTIGTSDTLDRRRMAPGRTVRLRVINTSSLTRTVTLTGTPYRITALDGTDVADPGEIRDARLVIGAASRYDLEFTMPPTPVRLTYTDAPGTGILFSADGAGELEPKLDGPEFNPTSYGAARPTEFDAGSDFDRTFDVLLDEQFGFYDGKFTARMTVNGEVFPYTPMHMVSEGDLVKMRFVNRGDQDHPMHVHGHHFLVLSMNGQRPSGAPLWLDTVNVRPGEIWEIGFRADNPGVWMDHCHNFNHTNRGMVLHLAYQNVTTPYRVGGPAHNNPS